MSIFYYNNMEIYYEIAGPEKATTITFINGLTQRVQHWKFYKDYLTSKGYRVLLFDLMGQGQSMKPSLFVDFKENEEVLKELLDFLKIKQAVIAGISFGGVVALKFAIDYPHKVKALIPISTFSEMDEQLYYIGKNLYLGMIGIGFEYLVQLLLPFNFSSAWLKKNSARVPIMIRESFSYNDVYAIQNLMESVISFKGFSDELKKITVPTLILNGEYDSLTPRWAHDIIRKNISSSKLVIMQHVCHAFTIEIPEITVRIIEKFLEDIEKNSWQGDQSVWVANDSPNEPLLYPYLGDALRNLAFLKTEGAKK